MRETSAAFARAGAQASKGLRTAEKHAAEPVRRDAEELAQSKIPRIGREWWRMRVGVTQRLVYVAPVRRGVRRGDLRHARPNLAYLLMERAMRPALEQNADEVSHAFAELFDQVCDDFNRGGA
jgi:hypothetical protein